MLGLIICLAVFCLALLFLLVRQNDRSVKTANENGVLKGRLETIQASHASQTAPEDPVSVEGIDMAVRYSGYVPEKSEHWVRFLAAGDPFYIETDRLPSVFIFREYYIKPEELEMDLFRHAAHLMSDELIMVKAFVYDDSDDPTLRFLVAAIDANNASFRENLARYVTMINDGRDKMHEIYAKLVKERKDASLSVNPYLPAKSSESKVIS